MCLHTYTNIWYVLKFSLMEFSACTPELNQEQVCGTCLGSGMDRAAEHSAESQTKEQTLGQGTGGNPIILSPHRLQISCCRLKTSKSQGEHLE